MTQLIANTVDEPIVAYRIVKSMHRSDPVMLDALRSNYELEASPRGVSRSSWR